MNETPSPAGSEPESSPPQPQPSWSVWLRLAAAIAAIAVIAGAAVLLRGIGTHRSAAGLGALDARSPVVNQPAPNFVLSDLNGHNVRLSDLHGQVVLVNFWATWCVPCRQEMPAIAQVYTERKGQGFTALEINEQESPAAIQGFASQIGALPPVLLDHDGSVMRQYHLQGLPDSFIIDRQGVVHALSYGPVTRQTILAYIDSAQ